MTASAFFASGQAIKLALDSGERIVERVHENAAHGIDDQRPRAVLRFDHGRTAARRAGRIIDRTDHARRAFDEDQGFLLVPGVIAERHCIGAGFDEFLIDRLCDAETAGRILSVDHDEIELPVTHELRQALVDNGAPAAADNVADEQISASSRAPQVDDLAFG